MNNIELVNEAKIAMNNAYAPYSEFKVGAALLTENGKLYTGCNIENASYGATMCAERTAIFKAVSEGNTKFSKIAIVSIKDDYTYPCGMCLQVMSEFVDTNNFKVILSNMHEQVEEYNLKELLPFGFSKDNL